MFQMSISEFKKLTAAEIKNKLPIALTTDGLSLGVVLRENPPALAAPGKTMTGTLTKCPNCKMEFTVKPSDGRPFYFTGKHPKL